MYMKKLYGSFFILFLFLSFSTYGQTTIAEWNFDDSDGIIDAGITANNGKTLTTQGGTSSITYTSGYSLNAAKASGWDGGNGTKYWQIEISTTGYQDLTVSSRQYSSLGGPRDFELQYRIGSGGVWTSLPNGNGTVTVAQDWTTGILNAVDLPSEASNQSSVYLRWIMTSDHTLDGMQFVTPGGGSRIDDIIISGNSVTGNPTIEINSYSLATGNIQQNTTEAVLYRLDLTATVTLAHLTEVILTTDGTYVTSDLASSSFKLWISDDDIFDSGSDTFLRLVGIVDSGNDLDFSGLSQTIYQNTTKYLFLTVDVDGNATPGHTIGIQSTAFSNITFSPTANKIGTDPAPAGNFQTIAQCIENSDIVGSVNTPDGSPIASFGHTQARDSVEVLEFLVYDYGECDGRNTVITNIRLKPQVTNTASWTNHIAGIIVNVAGGATSVNDPATITDSYIDIPIADGSLSIPDGTLGTIDIYIYLNETPLTDNQTLAFYIDSNDPGFTIGSNSSNLNFSSDINSNDFTIDVTASELRFVDQPVDTDINVPMASDVTVEATDVYGNRDLDFVSQVDLSSSGTMQDDPLQVNAVSGLATYSSIVHTVADNGIQLSASATGLTSSTSGTFDIIQTADHLAFAGFPSSGLTNTSVTTFTVEAQKPDNSVDTNYPGDITITKESGPGTVSGTLVKTPVNGITTFDDIQFDQPGNYTLRATSGTLTDGVSSIIAIVTPSSVFPNGPEDMGQTDGMVFTIADHELNDGFKNVPLTMTDGGAANPADIRDTNGSTGYSGSTAGANVYFTGTDGEYGFSIEGIDASTYTDLKLSFGVYKSTAALNPFADLTVQIDYGTAWQDITVSNFPTSANGAGWYLVDQVSLPTAAEVSNLKIRFIKQDTIRTRIDDINLIGTPKVATQLVVSTINNDLPPVVNSPFDVVVDVRDINGDPANVLENTPIQLTLITGTGNLSGTLTGTIVAGTSQVTISGVTYDASETGVVLDASRNGSGDNVQAGSSASFRVLAAEPTVQASGLSFSDRTTNSLTLEWTTNGDGAARIVLAHLTDPVDTDPEDGTTYSANADFGSGDEIGTGNYVVYVGAGSSVTVTNLQPNNTTYQFAIYEYNDNGTATLENYLQTSPATISGHTTCNVPLTQASGINFTNYAQNSITANWTNGDGDGRVVVINSSNSFTTPGAPPATPNTVWQNTGQQVVYFGSGSSATVTGLSPASTYWFRVYESNCGGADIQYNTTDNATSTTTYLLSQDFTTCPPTGWLTLVNSGNGWQCTAGAGNVGYESANGLGGTGASQTWLISPKRNFDLLASEALSFDSWTDGTDTGYPTLQVLYSDDYSGSGNPNVATWMPLVYTLSPEQSQAWTSSGLVDLSALSGDNYIAFKYTSSGTTSEAAAEWRIDNVLITNDGCAEPSAPASNLTFSNINQHDMTLTFTPGNGTRRIVVAKEESAVDATPVDGNTYNADASFGSGFDFGGGNYVVYNGTGNSVNITNLNPATAYYFAIFEYNCDGTSANYSSTSATGSQATLDPNGSDIVEQSGYTYPSNIDYMLYQAPNLTMTTNNSLSVFGLTLRDGGASMNDTDGTVTDLTSISFSTNGSTAIRAAAIYDGTNFTAVNVNGSTSVTIDLSSNPVVAMDNSSTNFELYVTFETGNHIVDNEQVQFTVTAASTDPSGSSLQQPDGGGATSSILNDDNRITVDATQLQFVQVPEYSIPLNEVFAVEVEAIDDQGTRDRDKSLTISTVSGTGNLTAVSGLTKNTSDSTAYWDDLMYDTPETIQLQVSDGGSLTLNSGNLIVKARFAIFTFTGASGDEVTFAPDNQPAHVTISDISRGSSISAQTLSNAFNANNWPESIETDSYYEITITPDAGYNFSLSSLEFDHRSTSTGPGTWEIRSDVDLDNFATPIDVGNSTQDGVFTRNADVDMSAITDQSGAVRIRFYGYNSTSGSGTWALDNIEIFGTTTDVGAPNFTLGYPQAINNTVSGFDLIVNLDEAGKVYYLIQPNGDPAPDQATVVAANNTIDVPLSDTDYTATINSLTEANGYDVYFVTEDAATNQSQNDPPINLINVRTSDTDSDILAPASQVPSGTISSTADTQGEAIDVFRFVVEDKGTTDGLPTKVSRIYIKRGSLATSPVADWTTAIQGITLQGSTLGNIPLSNVSILPDNIVADIDTANFKVANNSTEEITMAVYLNNTSLVDNEELDFELSTIDGDNTTSIVGSQFDSPISSGVTSEVFTIDVTADRLVASGYPVTLTDNTTPFSLTIQATDENGNVDTDIDGGTTFNVTLSRDFGAGEISSVTGLTQALVSGTFTWSDLLYAVNDDVFTILADADNTGIQDTVTDQIIVGSPGDLIVSGNLTLTQNLTVNNVVIQSTGNLTLSSGITLAVAGDFTVDDGGVLNDLGATTVFNGTTGAQQITGTTTGPVTFYNITVTNAVNAVNANVDINLINTLTLNDAATFDTDGTTDDKNFTLLSDANGTARIAPILNGAVLNGEIVWQRFLPANTPGSRYVSTPIKGQTLNSWADDFRIQGVTGLRPGYDPNVWTYTESLGTNGSGGIEGWTPFQNINDNLPVGPGMRIYIWSVVMQSDVIIDNKGLPFTGNGDSNDGSGTFTYSLSYTPTAYGGGGWNLLGNIYPSETDWDDNTDFVHTDIQGDAFYVWNPVTGNYATYNGVSGINGATRYIASGQSFWVQANSATSEVSINENAKSSGNGNSFIRVASEDSRELSKLRLKITSADKGYNDETAIAFLPNASDGYDMELDANKFGAGWINISSLIKNDDKDLAINAMGELRGAKSVPLRIRPYYYGTYSIDFNQYENFDPNAVLKLIDHYTNKSILISPAAQYQFDIVQNIPETYADGRLEIQFAEPVTLSIEDQNAKAGQEVLVYLTTDKLADVMASNFTLEWNSDALEFLNVEDFGSAVISMNNFDMVQTSSGKLTFDWKEQNNIPLDLTDGSRLFAIRFLAKSGIDNTEININKNSAHFTAVNDVDLPLNLKSGLIDILRNNIIAGAVKTVAGFPVDNVAVKLSGDLDARFVSGNDGLYNFDAYEQDQYEISASTSTSSDVTAGLSVLDIILTRRHLLGMAPLTNPYQVIAADVNGSLSVSILDIAEIQQVLLGNTTSFTGGSPWLFIPSVYDLSTDPFAYQTDYQFTMGPEEMDINFVGVKRGDVDISWNNNARQVTKDKITFDLSNVTIQGDEIVVPLLIKDFRNISGYQFTIAWDPRALEFSEVKDGAISNQYNTEIKDSGKIIVLWDDVRGGSMTLPDGTKLLELHFRTKNNDAKTDISVNSDVIQALAYNDNLDQVKIKCSDGHLNLKDQFDKPFVLRQNVPNPFTGYTDIHFRIPEKGKVTLNVVNMLGELVYHYEGDFDAGENVVTWNRNDSRITATPGVYIYSLESGGYSAMKKLIIK